MNNFALVIECFIQDKLIKFNLITCTRKIMIHFRNKSLIQILKKKIIKKTPQLMFDFL